MSHYQTVGDIINRVAVSVGLTKQSDPFASADPSFVQLCTLANEVGDDLSTAYPWQVLEREKAFTTAPGDTGVYALPDDFCYMIDQTAWQKAAPGVANYPLLGPATPQWWAYLKATELYNVTLYAWFRVAEGKLHLWPQPPPEGIPISYRYISHNWVLDSTSVPATPVYKSSVDTGADTPLYEPILFLKKLKLAFLQAKGFDTTKAQDEYMATLDSWTGKDRGAPVLSLNERYQGNRFLNGLNIPETGYGS